MKHSILLGAFALALSAETQAISLRSSIGEALDANHEAAKSCNQNTLDILICKDGSSGPKWSGCGGSKSNRKFCPVKYVMCNDGACVKRERQCRRKGGTKYTKKACTTDSGSGGLSGGATTPCNPNSKNLLICKDGNVGKNPNDWGVCGRNWKSKGSRLYCPGTYYQCENGFCSKNAKACKGSALKYKPYCTTSTTAFACPKNSFQKTKSAVPRSFDDCECNPGFRKGAILDGAVCYLKTTTAFACPKNSFQKTKSAVPRSFDDCECNPGFRKGAIQDGAVCYAKACTCPRIYKPVCAGGKTYSNACEAECAGHKSHKAGACSGGGDPFGGGSSCFCPSIYKPVCAGGKTYSNACEAECAGHKSHKAGVCSGGGGLSKGATTPCNPNSKNILICKDGKVGKNPNDWGVCGRNWKSKGSRLYCPGTYYQCENGFCSKNAKACKGSALKYKPYC